MEEIIICSDLHPDIELGFKRNEQKLYLELPANGINEDTGLIVFINDFNSDAEDEYPRKVLKPYLSNRYNCVVMGTNYFGLRNIGGIHPTKSLITNLNSIYATQIDPEPIVNSEDKESQTEVLLEMILEELGKRRITALDPRCQFKIVRKDGGYESWGFLPAIDLLNSVGTVIEKYNLNRKKNIVYGLGYGGYVAKLMGKFAPNTFSVIIDKSGFSEVKINHIAGHELQEPDFMINLKNRAGEDVLFYLTYNNPWTIMDEESNFYFGDTHRLIRSITEDRHRVASETRYYIFHSVEDDIDPIGNCDKSTDVIKKYNKTFYERIDSSKLGKSIFKNCSHDLGVSTRGLFDYVAGMDDMSLEKKSALSDFDMESEHYFDCGSSEYLFKYSKNSRVEVSLNKK